MNISIMVNLKTLLTLIQLMLPSWAIAQYSREYVELTTKADSLYLVGEYEASSETFGKALEMKDFIQPIHLYNGACAAALADDIETAFSRLYTKLEREKDWYSDNIANDEDLISLHDDSRWHILIDSLNLRKHRLEANFDKPLRRRLQMIMKTDQEVRIVFLAAHNRQPHDSIAEAEALHEMQRVDKLNQEQICKILDSKGFVGSDKVGNAVGTFWAVIQHSDINIQKKYLPLFREAAQRGDIAKESVAMMEDRINMFEGKPQRYGSQIEEDEHGNPRLYKLLDESKVDEWRSEMGMEPLKDYLRKMRIYR